MATIDNIKDLIKNKIEGQGSQVDIGNGLPSVLNGMAELIEKSQGLLGKGYLFMGFYHLSQIPEVPESGNYFVLCDDFSSENPVLSIKVSDDGSWVSVAEFYIYNTANLIENNREESDGYVTPAGIVDYCKDFITIPSLEVVGNKKEGDTAWLGFDVAAVPAIKINGSVYSANPVMTDALITEVFGDSQLTGVYKVFSDINYNDDNTVEGTFWVYGYSTTLFPTKNLGFVQVIIQQFPWGN